MKRIFLALVGLMACFGISAQDVVQQQVIDSLKNRIKYLEWRLEQFESSEAQLPYGSKVYATPVSYENKKSANFKVFQTFNGYALASAQSESGLTYTGPVVVLLGDYYSDQVIKVKKPQILGTYAYEAKGGRTITAPIVSEESAKQKSKKSYED